MPIRAKRRRGRTATASLACRLALFVAALAGCSELGLGRQEPKPDPNAYPANYKTVLLAYVRSNPVDMLNAREVFISTPALKQFGSDSRYFVCLRADGQDWRKEKIVVFFSGQMTQFVDATSGQCGAAAYQSFPELLPVLSQSGGKN
jgi:hypothetical protein